MNLDDEDDFGFTAVSEDELKEIERQLETVVQQTTTTASTLEQKLNDLYDAIMPLLNNLEKNPEREYIYWPNRQEKIKSFKEKLFDIVNQ